VTKQVAYSSNGYLGSLKWQIEECVFLQPFEDSSQNWAHGIVTRNTTATSWLDYTNNGFYKTPFPIWPVLFWVRANITISYISTTTVSSDHYSTAKLLSTS